MKRSIFITLIDWLDGDVLQIPNALRRVVGKTIEINTIEDINNPSAKTVLKWNLK